MKNKSQIIVPHKTMKNKGKIMGLLSLLFLLFSILSLVSIIFIFIFIFYNSIVEEEGREEKRVRKGKGKDFPCVYGYWGKEKEEKKFKK